ncbi:hypothetical protein L7F22_003089 [Adiantum nelumboides]|nr:hypothetical protein [Adiantum nelumboides]
MLSLARVIRPVARIRLRIVQNDSISSRIITQKQAGPSILPSYAQSTRLLHSSINAYEQNSGRNFRRDKKSSKRRGKDIIANDEETFASASQITNSISNFILKTRPQIRIVRWGISGQQLRTGAENILGNSNQINDEQIIRDLLQHWWKEAMPFINVAMNEPNEKQEFWDPLALKNLREDQLVEVELRRLVICSFISWLEHSLVKVGGSEHLVTHLRLLQKAVDMRFPSLRNNAARLLTRKIHLHVGPTNSGKTHGALQALCKAKTGLYAGPLRLLAHEVWYRINEGLVSPNIPPRECNLVTGEETKTTSPSAGLLACTVEMIVTDRIVDVAVIDEIQMIADEQRGFAWTAALLNVAAKEIHLCGEASVVPLIKKIARDCGDEVIVNEYQRLTPLRVGEPLGDLSKITKGDCIVAFSRTGIFNVKNEIERLTGLKCAVAYGALPPETKAEQAKLFNDPNNDVDVMVASDAIGMGLNLKIKRVIFTEVNKWNGKERKPISFSQIKQIAGRAGRYGTNAEGETNEGGIATTLKADDLETLKIALQAPLKPITHASIAPELEHLSNLATLIPVKSTEGSETLTARSYSRLLVDASLLFRIDHSKFTAGSIGQQTDTMPIIEASMPRHSPLTLTERNAFSNAPINMRDEELVTLFGNMVRLYAYGNLNSFEDVEKGSGLLDILHEVERVHRAHKPEEFENEALEDDNERAEKSIKSDKEAAASLDINTLISLETLHRGLTVYRWLSMRFPIAFPFYTDAADTKLRTERAIDYCLELIRANRQRRLLALGRKTEKKKGSHSNRFDRSRTRRSKNPEDIFVHSQKQQSQYAP